MSRLKIPIGPQHPILKEPLSIQVDVEGENIVDVALQMGFIHRGIEKLAQTMTYVQSVALIERICGICSHVHTNTFCQSVETLAGVEIPPRAVYLRTLMCELERIHSHLLWLGVLGRNIGQNAIFMYAWRDRELVLDVMEAFSGGRVSHQANCVGGVRFNPTSEEIELSLKFLHDLEFKVKTLLDIIENSDSFISRTKDLGILSKQDVLKYGIIGPIARASGINFDLRRDRKYGIYDQLNFNIPTRTAGDVWSRAIVRMEETQESLSLCNQIIKNLPDGEVRIKVPKRIPAGETICRSEAPRGEVVYYLRSDGSEKPARLKIRTPTLPSLAAFPELLEGASIADMTVIISGHDLCIACAER